MLKDKILNKEPGIILYGMTPPKENTDILNVKKIASKQLKKLTEYQKKAHSFKLTLMKIRSKKNYYRCQKY